MRYSLFSNVKSKIPLVEECTWEELVCFLVECTAEEYDDKLDAMLISPAVYDGDFLRCNENVMGWDFVMLDIDNGISVHEMIGRLNGLEYFIYSTASCQKLKHKFRLVMPLSRFTPAMEVPKLWYALAEIVGKVDQQCKDQSRIYFLPGTYKNAYNFMYYGEGEHLDVDVLLQGIDTTTYNMLKEVDINIPAAYNTVEYHWIGLLDCPFVAQSWIYNYLMLANGEDKHYAELYKFMMRVAGSAKRKEYQIDANRLASLASELDLKKDGRWNKQGRKWVREAQNAIKHIYGRN